MTLINPPTQVCLLATDRANTVTRRSTAQRSKPLAYTPFGHRSPEHADVDAGAGFNGHYLESLGAYLLGNGYRAYRPILGRFVAPDSYSPFWGGGLNSYTYCRGEPVNRRDPSGHRDVARHGPETGDFFSWLNVAMGLSLSAVGLGVLAGGGRGFAGLGAGFAIGGVLQAGMGVAALEPTDQGTKTGMNIGAIGLLVAGVAAGGAVSWRSSSKTPTNGFAGLVPPEYKIRRFGVGPRPQGTVGGPAAFQPVIPAAAPSASAALSPVPHQSMTAHSAAPWAGGELTSTPPPTTHGNASIFRSIESPKGQQVLQREQLRATFIRGKKK